MNYLKYLPLLSFLLACHVELKAQLVSISPSAGAAITTFDYAADYVADPAKASSEDKIGADGGIKFDINLGRDWLSTAPEFFFIQNGSKEYYTKQRLIEDLVSQRLTLDYLGVYLPLRVKYMGSGDFGPYGGSFSQSQNGILFEMAFYGDYVVGTAVNGNLSESSEIIFADGSDKFDFGASALLGFVASNFKMEVGYNLGLKDIEFSKELDGGKDMNYFIRNKGFFIRAGYVFQVQ